MKEQKEGYLTLHSKKSKEFTIKIPIKTYSKSNTSEHWAQASKRAKHQKDIVKLSLLTQKKPELPCEIVITRIAPRSLDKDNLGGALKTIIDTVCDWLIPGLAPGRADGDKRIKIDFDQKKGDVKEYAVEVMFRHLEISTKD